MQNDRENIYLLVGVRGVLGTSNSVWWLFLSTTGSSTTFILLFCIISCNMLNNSSARAHLKAKIPTNINQKGNMATKFGHKSSGQQWLQGWIKGQRTSDCWTPGCNWDICTTPPRLRNCTEERAENCQTQRKGKEFGMECWLPGTTSYCTLKCTAAVIICIRTELTRPISILYAYYMHKDWTY